ncbi:MAG: hypothetical protein KDB61_06340, partial [Planctomycetes bacterium]|nr:hypothetical protein [Planctomycetota bacterium]
MRSLRFPWRLLIGALSVSFAAAQNLPESGITGYWFFEATSPARTSQLYAVNPGRAAVPIPIGAPVDAVPSRWAHRRRTLGAMETDLASPTGRLWITPMGDAPGEGAIHVVDRRNAVQYDDLIPTGNPAAYDLAWLETFNYLFSVEESAAGDTVLRGFFYGTPGQLTPLSPSELVLAGPPSSYVNRIGVDESTGQIQVVGSEWVHVIETQATAPQMSVMASHDLNGRLAVTNPAPFEHAGLSTWMIGTSQFDGSGNTLEAGVFAWNESASLGQVEFGVVPSVPSKRWVPAAGCQELAVVSDGSDAYGYFLLREPAPGTFFIKPSAIGVAKLVGASALAQSTIPMPQEVGEPFAIPSVFGTRVAFESSFGPPFIGSPAGGGEKISILYSPLDPLGASSVDGVLGVPAPLGGRISTKGMDRPIWSADGRRVMAMTSHFPGAPNPGVPGVEVLDVPLSVPVDEFISPHRVVENLPFPNQSVLMPTAFRPRVPMSALGLGNLDFFGGAFHGGAASITITPWGEMGQLELDPIGF